MILARSVSRDRPADVSLAFRRLGLPSAAAEYLLEKVPQQMLLLTGLEKDDVRLLRSLAELSVAPGREEFPFYAPGDAHHRPGTALLVGRKEQHERLLAFVRAQLGREALALALDRALGSADGPPSLALGRHRFELGSRTYLVGVVNVTPDSFSDGGRFIEPAKAIAHGEALAREGAHLLDIGGESTRPGATPVTEEEELARVLPVIEGLAKRVDLPLSIDTSKAAVAKAALRAGATLVNDVSALAGDPAMAEVIAAANAACCLMHHQGTPATMQVAPTYGDVLEEVLQFLFLATGRAQAAGIGRDRLLVDPGIGFGKTLGHNLFLLRRLEELRVLALPVLVGVSRKRFLGSLTGDRPPDERAVPSVAAVVALAARGAADFVRVHDVQQTRDGLAVADALREATDGGALFERPSRARPIAGPDGCA